MLTPSGDKGAATLRIDVAENSSESPRSAIIRISVGSTTESFKILQKGTAGAPEINVLVDEVLAVGDFMFQQKCLDRLDHMLANGTTLLFVSHSSQQVRKLCTRAIWLDHGASGATALWMKSAPSTRKPCAGVNNNTTQAARRGGFCLCVYRSGCPCICPEPVVQL